MRYQLKCSNCENLSNTKTQHTSTLMRSSLKTKRCLDPCLLRSRSLCHHATSVFKLLHSGKRFQNAPVTENSVNSRTNWPFPSFPKPLFQSEAKVETIDTKMIFYSHGNTTYYHKRRFTLRLGLKVRVFGTPKLFMCWLVGSSLTVPNPWFVHRFGLSNLLRRSMGQ